LPIKNLGNNVPFLAKALLTQKKEDYEKLIWGKIKKYVKVK